MPAIKKINKEDIVKACMEIIRAEGIQSINARRVAKELGCSTQPIYYIYSNINEMKADALKGISILFDEAMLRSNYDKPAYKDIGRNYIQFAKDEPVFFKILFSSEMHEKAYAFLDITGPSKAIYETISSQTGLSEEDAKAFHLKMWLYVNGIANLVANDTCSFSDGEIDRLLGEQYISMLLFEINRGNIDKQVLDNANKNRLIMKGDLYNERQT